MYILQDKDTKEKEYLYNIILSYSTGSLSNCLNILKGHFNKFSYFKDTKEIDITFKESFNRGIKDTVEGDDEDLKQELVDIFFKYLWNEYHGKSSSYDNKIKQGLISSYLSHYISHDINSLPEGSIGYFLGRRNIPAASIKRVFKEKGFVLEKNDPSKADFFIVGDILTKDENKLNKDLKLPIVMEYNLNDYFLCNYGRSTTMKPNIPMLEKIMDGDSAGEKELNLLSLMLNKTNPSFLPNYIRVKILLFYLELHGDGFKYSDKKHKKLIETLKNVVLPYHKFYLEPKFLNTYCRLQYAMEERIITLSNRYYSFKGTKFKNLLGKLYLNLYGSSYFIPMSLDSYDCFLGDFKSLSRSDAYTYNSRFDYGLSSLYDLYFMDKVTEVTSTKYSSSEISTTFTLDSSWSGNYEIYYAYNLWGYRMEFSTTIKGSKDGYQSKHSDAYVYSKKYSVNTSYYNYGECLQTKTLDSFDPLTNNLVKSLNEFLKDKTKDDLDKLLKDEDAWSNFKFISKHMKEDLVEQCSLIYGDSIKDIMGLEILKPYSKYN